MLGKIRRAAESWFMRRQYPSLRPFFNITTHLTDREKVVLYRLASSLKMPVGRDTAIVEIGSYVGASSCFLAAGLCSVGRTGRVYCVDTWGNDAMTEGQKDTMSQFINNTQPFSKSVRAIRGWSTEVVDEVKRHTEEIDLLFIDGDHSYEGCLADWQAYRPLAASGATVVLHDIGWAEGVQRVAEEEIEPHCTSVGRLPNLWWGTLNVPSDKN